MSNRKEWQQMKRFCSDGWLIESECSCWYLLLWCKIETMGIWQSTRYRMGTWQWTLLRSAISKWKKKETNKQCNLDFDPNCDVVGGGFRCSTDKANGLICTIQHNTQWTLIHANIWLLWSKITRRKDNQATIICIETKTNSRCKRAFA